MARVGPTSLALDAASTLYVSDAIGNSVNAIADVTTRGTGGGVGPVVARDDLLERPLAMLSAPGGQSRSSGFINR